MKNPNSQLIVGLLVVVLSTCSICLAQAPIEVQKQPLLKKDLKENLPNNVQPVVGNVQLKQQAPNPVQNRVASSNLVSLSILNI